jgi:hypothetical protein
MSLLNSQSKPLMKSLAIMGCAALFSVAGSEPSESRRAGGLSGSWSGVGTIQLPSGDSERVRCRVRFRSSSGDLYSMNAVCASPSARAVQTAVLERVGSNRYAGSFHNAEYNYTGSIFITVRGDRLNASLSGGGASGHISLRRG